MPLACVRGGKALARPILVHPFTHPPCVSSNCWPAVRQVEGHAHAGESVEEGTVAGVAGRA
jgi:hypothetical protein